MGGGPLRIIPGGIPGGGPIEEVLARPLPMALPFTPPIGGLGAGAEDILGSCGAAPVEGDDIVGSLGLCWLTMFKWCSSAYSVSIRGTRSPTLCASFIGEPRYVSTSIGLFAV